MKKLIRYRIPISLTFPAGHPRKSEPTLFIDKITKTLDLHKDESTSETMMSWCREDLKLHTLRSNYALWAKRFEKINKGEAVLELYFWTGKPYNSKTVVIRQLGKSEGIGLEKILYHQNKDVFKWGFKWAVGVGEEMKQRVSQATLANNDGLSLHDFVSWFKSYDLTEPMALIHFTEFRYGEK
jgi:hypothetical protein